MGKIDFNDIHNLIIDFLKIENNNELEIVAYWYFHFLESNEEKLSLHLPYYSDEFTRLSFNYIRAFTFTYKLLQSEKLNDFENTCLFDILNKSSNLKIDDLTLDFSTKKENIAKWGEDTFTKLDSFLPVFNKEEIIHFNKPKTIKTTFELFKSIRNSGELNFPILIELDKKILSFNNLENINNVFVSENLFTLNNRLNRKEAIEIKKELNSYYASSIIIKYPYSIKPTFPLTEIGKKKFLLSFNNRFAYNDIMETDLFLLKDETQVKTKIVYSIVDTNHSKDLYDLFKSFKEQWVSLELNKFTTPFPKYWFLFLNPSLTAEAWLIQFKKDFPAVAEKPIINIIENIIKEVIDLKWIDKLIENSPTIFFPKLKSNRKKRLEFVYNNFKNYVASINPNVGFIDNMYSLNDFNNVVVLDSFNIIDLANINQCNYQGEINVIVPDFLYFGYQPWIKFHLFNYQFAPLYNGLRKVLDNNYTSNIEEIEKLKKKIIIEIKSDYKKYKSKFISYTEEEIEENPNIEDIEYTNYEEIDNAYLEIKNNKQLVIINQNLENEISISFSEKVLIQKDTLLYIKAGFLNKGDFIIRNSDILKLYKSEKLFNKLVNIPENILTYQNQLFRTNNAYKILKSRGFSIETEYHFKTHYLIEHYNSENFILPRRKKDRIIVCDFLNISKSDLDLAFVARYGRTKKNELKEIYKLIIELLLENNWIGTSEDPNIIMSVSKIIIQYNSIFKTSDENEIVEISESIISTIIDQLTFVEIKTIKIIENE